MHDCDALEEWTCCDTDSYEELLTEYNYIQYGYLEFG